MRSLRLDTKFQKMRRGPWSGRRPDRHEQDGCCHARCAPWTSRHRALRPGSSATRFARLEQRLPISNADQPKHVIARAPSSSHNGERSIHGLVGDYLAHCLEIILRTFVVRFPNHPDNLDPDLGAPLVWAGAMEEVKRSIAKAVQPRKIRRGVQCGRTGRFPGKDAQAEHPPWLRWFDLQRRLGPITPRCLHRGALSGIFKDTRPV
jgi:hypothetical protein